VTISRITQPRTADEARAALAAASVVIDSPTQRQIFSIAHIDDSFARGFRKPEWVWTAIDVDGAALGTVAAWGPPGRKDPWLLDFLDLPINQRDVACALVTRAIEDCTALGSRELDINLFVTADDPLDEPTTAAVVAILEECRYRILVQRRRYRLEPATSTVWIPPLTLRFDPATGPDDPRLVDVYEEILVGSLDAHDQRALDSGDIRSVARETIVEYLELDPIESFFLAIATEGDDEGKVVGLVIGGLRGSADRGVASFIGVSHRYRGRGYASQLLGWITAKIIDEGAAAIIAETDVANVPMAKAFDAIGYPQVEGRIDLVAVDTDAAGN
jgi:ribosomal protein S18 acetylase RimI-like enzyme